MIGVVPLLINSRICFYSSVEFALFSCLNVFRYWVIYSLSSQYATFKVFKVFSRFCGKKMMMQLSKKSSDSPIPSSHSFVPFLRPIPSSHSFVPFLRPIPSSHSFVRFCCLNMARTNQLAFKAFTIQRACFFSSAVAFQVLFLVFIGWNFSLMGCGDDAGDIGRQL